jgi:branched-chain amino acid transport system substrate-binding protein
MNKTIKIALVVIAVILIVWIVIAGARKNDSGELNIGVISTLTGPVQYIGESTMKGAEIAKMKIAKEHPELKVNLYHEDSRFDPKTGIDAYNKLRSTHNINALVTMASNVSVAVEPVALKDNVLIVAASTLANGFTTPNDLSFRVTSKVDTGVSVALDYLKKKGLNKLGIIYMTNEIGISLKDGINKSVDASGIKVVAEEGYAPDATDFRTILLKMKNSGVDSIYLASLASHTSTILKQAKELGITTTFISYQATEDTVLIKNAGALAEGIVYVNAYDVNSTNPQNVEFSKMYRDKYNEEPNGYAAEAYEATRIIADVYSRCGSTVESPEARDCAKNLLFGMKSRPSLFGLLAFDNNGDVTYPFFMKTVRDGKFVRLTE